MRGTVGGLRQRPPLSKVRRHDTEEERVTLEAAPITGASTAAATPGETAAAAASTGGTETEVAEEGATNAAAAAGEGSAADTCRWRPRRAATSGSGWVLGASSSLEGCQVRG